MKIFFSEANPIQYPDLDTSTLFRDPETRQYYFYMIETDDDGCFRLHDSCNRMVPFDVESIESLCEATYALQEITNLCATIQERVRDEVEEVINVTHQYTGVRILG